MTRWKSDPDKTEGPLCYRKILQKHYGTLIQKGETDHPCTWKGPGQLGTITRDRKKDNKEKTEVTKHNTEVISQHSTFDRRMRHGKSSPNRGTKRGEKCETRHLILKDLRGLRDQERALSLSTVVPTVRGRRTYSRSIEIGPCFELFNIPSWTNKWEIVLATRQNGLQITYFFSKNYIKIC